MSLAIRTNVNALLAQSHHTAAARLNAEALARAGSGERLQWAAQDVSGAVASAELRAQVASLGQVRENLQRGRNLFLTMEAGLSSLGGQLTALRAELVAGADEARTPDRADFEMRVQRRLQTIDRLIHGARFAGAPLFDLGEELDGRTTARVSQTFERRRTTVNAVVNRQTNAFSKTQSFTNATANGSTGTLTQAPKTITVSATATTQTDADVTAMVPGGQVFALATDPHFVTVDRGGVLTEYARAVGPLPPPGDAFSYDAVPGELTLWNGAQLNPGDQVSFANVTAGGTVDADGHLVVTLPANTAFYGVADGAVDPLVAPSSVIARKGGVTQAELLAAPGFGDDGAYVDNLARTVTLAGAAKPRTGGSVTVQHQVATSPTGDGAPMKVSGVPTGVNTYAGAIEVTVAGAPVAFAYDGTTLTLAGNDRPDATQTLVVRTMRDVTPAPTPDGDYSIRLSAAPEQYRLGQPDASLEVRVNGVALPVGDFSVAGDTITITGAGRPVVGDVVSLSFWADRNTAGTGITGDDATELELGLSALAERYELGTGGAVESLRVEVDGAPVAAFDPVNNPYDPILNPDGFEYDETNQRLILHGAARPGIGQSVQVWYHGDSAAAGDAVNGTVTLLLSGVAAQYNLDLAEPPPIEKALRVYNTTQGTEIPWGATDGFTYNGAVLTINGAYRPDAKDRIDVYYFLKSETEIAHPSPPADVDGTGADVVTLDPGGAATVLAEVPEPQNAAGDGTGGNYRAQNNEIDLYLDATSAAPAVQNLDVTFFSGQGNFFQLVPPQYVTLPEVGIPVPLADSSIDPKSITVRVNGVAVPEGDLDIGDTGTTVTLTGASAITNDGDFTIEVAYTLDTWARQGLRYGFTVGEADGRREDFFVERLNLSVLTLDDLRVSDRAEAAQALARVDYALDTLLQVRTEVGAALSFFDAQLASADQRQLDTRRHYSQIADADLAAEAVQAARTALLMESGVRLLAQVDTQPRTVVRLLARARGE